MTRKGQAPMEHIAVYAWSFIMLAGFVGVLVYFDFFSLEKYSAQTCTFDANYFCHDFVIIKTAANEFNLRVLLQNNMNKEIEVYKVTLLDNNANEIVCSNLDVFCRFDEPLRYAFASPSNDVVSITDISKQWSPTRLCKLEFTDCSSIVTIDNKKEVNLELSFRRAGNPSTHSSYGVIYANVN